MASPTSAQSAFFPPLDRVLSGAEQLISFKVAFRALCDSESASESPSLEAFLTDESTVRVLANATQPLERPSAKSRGEFETKTAPIHVGQSSDGSYDLQQLKEDALWLSKELDIEELIGLRISVLEWQTRAAFELLATNEYSLAAVKESKLGLARSTNDFSQSMGENGHAMVDYSPPEVRHQRQLQIYLEEQTFVKKVKLALVEMHVVLRIQDGVTENERSKQRRHASWIEELASKMAKSQQDSVVHSSLISQGIDGLSAILDKVNDPAQRPLQFQPNFNDAASIGRHESWTIAAMQDILSMLRFVLAGARLDSQMQPASTITAWFHLMEKYSFLSSWQPDVAEAEALLPLVQCIVATISVGILAIPQAVEHIQNAATAQFGSSTGAGYPILPSASEPYIEDVACVKELTLIFYHAAQGEVIPAAPAIYAWSLLTTLIRDVSHYHQMVKDRAIEESSAGTGSDERPSPTLHRHSSWRRSSTEPKSMFEKLYDSIQDTQLDPSACDDPPRWLAGAAVDNLNVYTVMTTIIAIIGDTYRTDADFLTAYLSKDISLTVIKEGMSIMSYGEEVVDAVLSILTPPNHPPGRASSMLQAMLAARLSTDEFLRSTILDQAFARYPYELSPLMKLLGGIFTLSPQQAHHSLPVIESISDITIEVPAGFRGFRLTNEDEGANEMVLIDAVHIFVSKSAVASYQAHQSLAQMAFLGNTSINERSVMAIPPGTPGVIIREDDPMVLRLAHPHSGLDYVVTLLATYIDTAELVQAPFGTRCDPLTASEILNFITSLLKACNEDREAGRQVTSALNSSLQHNVEGDFETLVADILETELLVYQDQGGPLPVPGSIELLVACVEYLQASLKLSPERVWSTLARSSLLGGDGLGSGALVAVVGAVELPSTAYAFFASCARLYRSLVDDAVSGLVRRKGTGERRTGNRFDSPLDGQSLTPERTITGVLVAYGTVMVGALQNLQQWTFGAAEQKTDICVNVLSAFDKLLHVAFGVRDPGQKSLAFALKPAAKNVLDGLAPLNDRNVLLSTIASLLTDTGFVKDDNLPSLQRQLAMKQFFIIAKVVTNALRIVSTDETRASRFAAEVLDLIPILARLMACEDSFRRPVSSLLQQALKCVGSNDASDQASIVRRLPKSAARSFLAILVQLDGPVKDIQTECSVWALLSAVMDSRLPWLAIHLLTGNLPKEGLRHRSEQAAKHSGRPLLGYALDQLSKVATLQPERAIAMLDFVAHAQTVWAWATTELRSHPEFLKNVLDWLDDLKPATVANPLQALLSARELDMAASVCNILSVNLHAGLETGDLTILDMLVPKLGFLVEYGVRVDAYNRSLHKNLMENFLRKYSACDVGSFKRTAVNPASYGKNFAYDLEVATAVLAHDNSWSTSTSTKAQGFADEFARANVNLSVVAAQTKLLHAWKRLAIMLCECLPQKHNLQGHLATAARQCLRVNAGTGVEQPGQAEEMQARLDLAFVLVSKLVRVKSRDEGMKKLFPSAWAVIRTSPVNYDVASAPQDLTYQRTLMQTLYMCIQPHVYMDSSSAPPKATDLSTTRVLQPELAAVFAELVGKVVAAGFRALCGNLHENISLARPADFVLLTAVLQSVLSVHGISTVFTQIAEAIAASACIQAALSLYSWSDQLAEAMSHDPVYGEVAIMFLMACSSVPAIAEQMAIGGVLAQLASANISNYFRKPGGKGPFDEPKRMFVIWSEGFLPICLNLLDAVGPPIAGEVALFLNSFPQQLDRASTALQNRTPSLKDPRAGSVTLGLLGEAHNLATISRVLQADAARGAAEGIDAADIPTLNWDKATVKEDVEALPRNKRSLKDRIAAVGEREEIWRTTAVSGDADNLLVAKVQKELNDIMHLGVFESI